MGWQAALACRLIGPTWKRHCKRRGYIGTRMPSSRFKATLRITGDALIPDDVTHLLGCLPTRAETKGEIRPSKHVARTGSWRLVASDRNPDDLEGQVAEIF